MTLGRLLLRNLVYHWRGNLAVCLGVAVGSAVLTGALLVGDSLRGSLREQVLEQLGWVDQALVAGRFFREDLFKELGVERAAPAMLLRGAATRDDRSGKPQQQAGRVMILGVDDHFWPKGQRPVGEDMWEEPKSEVVLNKSLADALGAREGSTVTLHLQQVSAVPRESLLGQRDAAKVMSALMLRVRGVLSDRHALARFSLVPNPQSPRNAFVPLPTLQKALGQKDRANALLVGGAAPALAENLRTHLTLDDWGLLLRDQSKARELHPYLSLESRQLLIEPAVAKAAEEVAEETGLRSAPTLVYLANSISDGARQIPYSVVAALDPALPSPLGPFLPAGVKELQDDEIVLADWKESPLQAKPGDKITLTYFMPEEGGRLPEETATFTLKGFVPLEGPADDPNLTPEFPGITDKLDISDWDPPFPYDNKRIQKRDEEYWRRYRTTPKAYVTLAAGQKLWSSRFGKLTSIRLAPASGGRKPLDLSLDLSQPAEAFVRSLLRNLKPDQGSLVFDDVRKRGLEASVGGPDFALYFSLFSFFLIISALLLVGLLFRLNLDRRGPEIGLLLAAGYRRRLVRWLLLAEGAMLAVAGGLVGALAAVLYTGLLLELLRHWWPGALDQSFLRLHVTPQSFLLGYALALLVSVLTILLAVWMLGHMSPRSLLAGETTAGTAWDGTSRRPRWSLWIGGLAGSGAAALVIAGRFMSGAEEQAMTFFGSGALLLTASLAGVWAWMCGARKGRVGRPGLWRLAVRNAARHPVRSILTVGLLASAVFLVISVESFHREAGAESLEPKTGTGGFALIGESDLPIFQDLNSDSGRDELNFKDSDEPTLKEVHFYPFRLRTGDDASCLNLYQPIRPTLLGVPSSLIRLDRFRFQAPSNYHDAWRLLQGDVGSDIPAIADATTAQYMLKKKLGETLSVPDERGELVPLRIVALLEDSIFQSQLLVSEANFLKLYPNHQGYSFFLIDAPAGRAGAVQEVLQGTLAERGFEVTPTTQRLVSFWMVENTYLATFQALGGLGLVLGALGLAVVLLRTVWERRGELALFRALGFRRSTLNWLVLAENAWLLALGLGAGAVSALVAVMPHLGRSTGVVPWLRLAVLLGGVLVVGLAAAAAAVAATLRAPLIPALRRE
jgi:ABC-type lipoprotein release transport system permease subunit